MSDLELVAFRASAGLLKQMDRHAQKTGRNRSGLIRFAVRRLIAEEKDEIKPISKDQVNEPV